MPGDNPTSAVETGADPGSGSSTSGVALNDHLKQLSHHHENDFRASSIARRLLRHCRGERILDAGCGTGRLTLELLRSGRDVVAIDHEEDLVELTNNLVAAAGFTAPVARPLALEDLDQLAGERFDQIYCCDVLEHVLDDGRALRQMHDLLKPHGQLVVTVPAWEFLYNERDRRMGHHRRYTRRSIRRAITGSGFTLDSMRWWNLSGFLLNALFIRGMKIRFSEGFRYRRRSLRHRIQNTLLRYWFHGFENHVPVPAGLTIICVASRA